MAGGSSQGKPLLAKAALTWPTPTVWVQGERPESWFARKAKNKAKGYNGNGQGTPLDMAVILEPMGFWPTPTASEYKTPYRGESLAARQAKRKEHLRDRISAPVGGKLNHLWVEWLMGWPLGHTEGGPIAYGVSATVRYRSVRQSRGDCSEGQ
jgi:hypothetical protein